MPSETQLNWMDVHEISVATVRQLHVSVGGSVYHFDALHFIPIQIPQDDAATVL